MAICGIDCDAGAMAGALAGGIGLGGLAGARIGRERWDDLPASQLADTLPR
jgi:outer membrane lipoprotein SlyB